jgi:hypothetical protein
MSKTIPLSQGMVVVVDDCDFSLVKNRKWCAVLQNGNYYAQTWQRTNGRYTTKMMHRLILGATRGSVIDHINGNGLDNRRSNLRFCSFSENQWNRKPNKNSKTGVKGVHWSAKEKKYVAQIREHGKRIMLGSFRSIEEAALAYREKAKQLFGVFAKLT